MLQKKENVPKILEKYLNYMIAVKGCSIRTIEEFSRDIVQFMLFFKDYHDIPIPVKDFNIFVLIQVKESDIIAFLVYLSYSKDNSPYTRQRKVTSLRSFYKWLFFMHRNIKGQNPTLGITSIKKVERLPKHLTLNQAKEIQNIFNRSNTKFPERNNAIISLFLCTGIRLSELININIIDIDFKQNSIVVFGKNSKERRVYFNNYCKVILLEYINVRKTAPNNKALFLNRFGERVGVQAIENICKNAYKLLGIDELGYSPHTLRHSAATIMYTHVKEDILLVKDFLGHSSIASTEIYTHIHNSNLKQAVEKNPLNNYKREGSE